MRVKIPDRPVGRVSRLQPASFRDTVSPMKIRAHVSVLSSVVGLALGWLLVSSLLWPVAVRAQLEPLTGLSVPGERDITAPIEVDADSLDYDRVNGRIVAAGNVHIVSGADSLRADRVLVNVQTGDAYALGNVELLRAGQPIRGDRLHYNFQTRVSSLDAPTVNADPFKVVAETVTRQPDNTFRLNQAKVTTCIHDHDHAHYHVRARRLDVVPDQHLTARHAVWYFGKVPVLYVPYWRRRLHDEYGWNLYPGYRSRWGGFLLTSYFHRVHPGLRLEHHVDLYSERGVGLGEDIDWRSSDGVGQLSLYYIHDNKPMGKNPPLDAEDIDASRYRIRLRHDQDLADRTRLFVRNEFVSDAQFRRDFFDREYRRLRQPENYLALSHQEDLFSVTALASFRLNDFYENVNRMPEVSLNWYRMQLGDSSFYYESQSSVAYLNRVFRDRDDREDFSAFRLDSSHTFYQPRRIAGWLNVVPRAGYRGTFYSASRREETSAEIVTSMVTNEVTLVEEMVTTTNIVTTVSEGGARLRHAIEIGKQVRLKSLSL